MLVESLKNSFISIHALRGEGDGGELTKEKVAKIFQSTPSVGRATLAKAM